MLKLVGYEVTLWFHKYLICLYSTLELNWPSALYMPRNLENIDVHACEDRLLDICLPVVRDR